jgi:hypothetical protein
MKDSIRLFLGALALAAPFALPVRAADSVPPRTTGRVLLLDSERVIEGQIEREGDQYRVRRSVGETRVPADGVLQLCGTMEEAYDFLRARANLRDPDERTRLARWCHLHNLPEQALAEARAAADLCPKNPEYSRWRDNLQRAAAVMGPPAPAQQAPPVDTAAPPPIEVNAESMGWFATRVQPILMNTCASCHVPGKAGAFKLTRSYDDGMVNRRATQQNLAAVLAQINTERWETSPLLTKAVSVHGEASQPPLKSRQAPAYRTLEEWLRTTLASNPQLKDRPAPVVVSASKPEPKIVPEVPPAGKETLFAAMAAPRATPKEAPPAVPSTQTVEPKEPVDPFDPVIFNRQEHAEAAPLAGSKK